MTIYVINSNSAFTNEYIHKNKASNIDVIVPNDQQLAYLQYLFKKNHVETQSLLTINDLNNSLIAKYNIDTSICTKVDIQLIVDSCVTNWSKTKAISENFNSIEHDLIDNIWNIQSIDISSITNTHNIPAALLNAILQAFADHNISFEQDIANTIVERQQSFSKNDNITTNNHILFFGFLPFTQHLAMIKAASLCYKTADIIVHDFGDNDIFFAWLETLEDIFGNIEFINTSSQEPTVETVEYSNIFDEIKSVTNNIKTILKQNSNTSIAVRMPRLSQYLPIIQNELKFNSIEYFSTFARNYQYPAIIKLWIKWQKTRLITDCCKFCSEMVSQNMLSHTICDIIFRQIKTLQTISLFRDYDRILEFGNIKNMHSFNALDEYDICYRSYTLSSFGQCFLNLFQKFLPQNIVDLIQTKLCNNKSHQTIPCNVLMEYIENIVSDINEMNKFQDETNVILLDSYTITDQEFSDVFVLGQDNVYETSHVISDIHIPQQINNILSETTFYLQKHYNDVITQSLHKLSHQCRNLHISYHRQSYVDHTNGHSLSQYVKYLTKNIIKKIPTNDVSQNAHEDQSDDRFKTFCESYKLRHDTNNHLNEYCFALDIDKTTPTACKSLEYLFKNPHVGFYTSVLGLQQSPWIKESLNKKITIGSLVHNFLQIHNAQTTCTKRISYDVFSSNIHQRTQQLLTQIEQTCEACDKHIPYAIIDAIQRSSVIAHKLSLRLLSHTEWLYFFSEYKLPATSYITIGSTKLSVSGIIDFIATNCYDIRSTANDNNVIIIDFKTGNDIELTERNIVTLIKKYNSLQLVLYGMALSELGIKNINLMLLRHDSANNLQPINLDYILQKCDNTMQIIESILTTGMIPKQIFGKQFRQYVIKDVPLATTDLY